MIPQTSTLADRERDYYIGTTKAMIRKEIMERVEVEKTGIYGNTYTAFENRPTGRFELVPCDIKEVCK
jgi:hypothetical protein